jgi:hypothetical protein
MRGPTMEASRSRQSLWGWHHVKTLEVVVVTRIPQTPSKSNLRAFAFFANVDTLLQNTFVVSADKLSLVSAL